jgi:hypothetical protein
MKGRPCRNGSGGMIGWASVPRMSPESTVPVARFGNLVAVHPSDRVAVWLGSILSVVVGVWALGSVALPFGVIGGAIGALFGLTFGGLAVLARAWGRWRKIALVGIAISCLALLVAAAEVAYAVPVE